MKRQICKKWRLRNKDQIRLAEQKKRASDPIFRLTQSLRARTRIALKGSGTKSSIKLLGASIETVKKHLETQFKEGMSWENYGQWHIDHIIPFAAFDLSNKDNIEKVCHYTNLQPLWAEENLKKGSRV